MLLESKALPSSNILRSSKFSKIWNWHMNVLFDAGDHKLGHSGIFHMFFPFLAFFKL